jgi:hypothetical protein
VFEREFVQADLDRSAHVVPAVAKSVPVQLLHVARSLALRGAIANHVESAKRAVLVDQQKAP